jgi:hypothetical protein
LFENFGPQKWWIAKLPKFATQNFSYKYVIQPAANYKKRKFAFNTYRVVLAHLKRAYRYWFYRCRELVCNDLWLPTAPDNNATVIRRAVAHCLYCTPSHVVLHKNKKPIPVNPCSQYQICPFCAARVAEDLYRRLMRALKTLKTSGATAWATYRCERYEVAAKGFADTGLSAAEFQAHVKKLREVLADERVRYQKISKEVGTQTLGALWAVVPYPADTGWVVEIRQFYLTYPQSRRPANRKRNSSELTSQSINIRNTKQVINLLGNFVTYPASLLTAHAELTAVVLHARRGLRLLNGTGQLYRKGREAKKEETIRTAAHVP